MRPAMWLVLLATAASAAGWGQEKRLPRDWGADHVGKPLPAFVTGDECLFCHREKIGANWSDNWHNRTVHRVEPDDAILKNFDPLIAMQAEFVLGGKHHARTLRSGADYGKLDLLTREPKPAWDKHRFAERCAGCHATAVDRQTKAFAAISIECASCHGIVPLEHSKDTTLVHLSRARKDAPEVVTSICAQCHARGGASKSTGLPYANHFVAGDNLFRDFGINLKPDAQAPRDSADRHVMENLAMVLDGGDNTTCLDCHRVHGPSGKRHHLVAESAICWTCHEKGQSKKVRKPWSVHSLICEY